MTNHFASQSIWRRIYTKIICPNLLRRFTNSYLQTLHLYSSFLAFDNFSNLAFTSLIFQFIHRRLSFICIELNFWTRRSLLSKLPLNHRLWEDLKSCKSICICSNYKGCKANNYREHISEPNLLISKLSKVLSEMHFQEKISHKRSKEKKPRFSRKVLERLEVNPAHLWHVSCKIRECSKNNDNILHPSSL